MVKLREIALILWVLASVAPSLVNALGRKRYDNYHVYQLEPRSEAQLLLLKSLEGRDGYSFLDGVPNKNTKLNVLIAPDYVLDFEGKLAEFGINFELLERDAQSKLENDEVADLSRNNGVYDWKKYHKLDDTYNWLRSLAQEYPENVSLFVAGKSYEGRDLLGIKISYGGDKKAIFIEAGIHAREWISPATATYITNQLLASTDKNVREIAESFDWYIVPHVNPDGYVYSHTTNRMWRKTRSPQKNDCIGADPNRNWGIHWNEVGTSQNPCSEVYAGSKPYSEIEMRTLADFIYSLRHKIHLYVSFHSYSQLVLFPYGFTAELAPNYDDLKRVSDAAVEAVGWRYGTKYVGGPTHDVIYPVSGGSIDWAYNVAGINYSYCYELRPSGASWYGFKLPADQIIPTGEETLDSLMVMVKESKKGL